jgi:hypothetical protein
MCDIQLLYYLLLKRLSFSQSIVFASFSSSSASFSSSSFLSASDQTQGLAHTRQVLNLWAIPQVLYSKIILSSSAKNACLDFHLNCVNSTDQFEKIDILTIFSVPTHGYGITHYICVFFNISEKYFVVFSEQVLHNFCSLMVLGFELKASCLLSRPLLLEPCHQPYILHNFLRFIP